MFRRIGLLIFTAVAVMMLAVAASAQMSFAGRVTDVVDGRTVVLAVSSGAIQVQLQYIEVPETGQQLNATVKDHLRNLVIGKNVNYRARSIMKDRTIGQLTVDGVDISQQMLRDGAAWHIPSQVSGQDAGEYQAYSTVEATAKSEKLGVWAIPGLKPAWKVRANEREATIRAEQTAFATNGARSAANITRGIANPAFGNVGSLFNRYDPETRTGLISTSFMPVEVEKGQDWVEKIALDVTYYYKENDRKGRKGSFVYTIVFLSKKPQFATANELTLWDNGKTSAIGKPKRSVSNQSDGVHETLIYSISRSTLERAANNEFVFFRIGRHVIHMTGSRYLLYNMLQVTQ